MTTPQHVVLGAGTLGITIAEQLAAAGEPVRLVTRSGRNPGITGIETAAADLTDPAAVRAVAAARGSPTSPPSRPTPTGRRASRRRPRACSEASRGGDAPGGRRQPVHVRSDRRAADHRGPPARGHHAATVTWWRARPGAGPAA